MTTNDTTPPDPLAEVLRPLREYVAERHEQRLKSTGLMAGAIAAAECLRLAEDALTTLARERDSAVADAARLRKLFDDAGQGEYNVLALIDHYQDEARRVARERDEAVAARDEWCRQCNAARWPTPPICRECLAQKPSRLPELHTCPYGGGTDLGAEARLAGAPPPVAPAPPSTAWQAQAEQLPLTREQVVERYGDGPAPPSEPNADTRCAWCHAPGPKVCDACAEELTDETLIEMLRTTVRRAMDIDPAHLTDDMLRTALRRAFVKLTPTKKIEEFFAEVASWDYPSEEEIEALRADRALLCEAGRAEILSDTDSSAMGWLEEVHERIIARGLELALAAQGRGS